MVTKGLAGDGGGRIQEGGGEHNNQPKEGRLTQKSALEAMQQATNSWRNKKTRGQCNTNASTTMAMIPLQQGQQHQCNCNNKVYTISMREKTAVEQLHQRDKGNNAGTMMAITAMLPVQHNQGQRCQCDRMTQRNV
jgi:hypothetical protein